MSKICSRCIQDESIPNISFDENGVCNYCHLHDSMENQFPNNERGQKKLNLLIEKIKKSKNKEFNCIVALSGGRDSTYLLYKAVIDWKLKPLAVFFNDGFSNPIAGENIKNAIKTLNVKLITVTSDWRESKDIRISLLKASVPELFLGTEVGLANALYTVAANKNIKYILNGQSFRTEGIKPLPWAFFDGKYLKSIQKEFGKIKWKKWKKNQPSFNLGIREMIYFSLIKKIKVFMPLYFEDYIKSDVDNIIKDKLNWKDTGFHYFDDLYHSLIRYVHREKFGIDFNMNSDAALVRSNQVTREDALINLKNFDSEINSKDYIDLCINRLGLSKEEFEKIMKLKTKSFLDYKTNYYTIKLLKVPIYLASRLNLIPKITYSKYFECGIN